MYHITYKSYCKVKIFGSFSSYYNKSQTKNPHKYCIQTLRLFHIFINFVNVGTKMKHNMHKHM